MSDVYVSGIGLQCFRRSPRSGLDLTVEAALEAIADAKLDLSDIDGVATWPGSRASDLPAFSPTGCEDVIDAFRLKVNWYSGGPEGPSQLAALINAWSAIKSGLCRHVLCFRTVKEGTGGAFSKTAASWATEQRTRKAGDLSWRLPFHGLGAANWIGPFVQRYMHDHALTREQLAQIALTARANAALNPKAVYREPMTLEDYLGVRMVSDPVCLYDCDVPVDAATVIVLSSGAALADRTRAVRIDALSGALSQRPSWNFLSPPRMAAHDVGADLWTRTKLTREDVDVACLYDGFSFLAATWIEALGFCESGKVGAFLEGGHRIARDGELPLNPHGGQLSAGRTHGYGYVHEAVAQLRGEAGERQVKGHPDVAAVACGGGYLAGAMLLVGPS